MSNHHKNIYYPFGYEDALYDESDFDLEEDDVEHGICPMCNGSGEGSHSDSTCYVCGGSGET